MVPFQVALRFAWPGVAARATTASRFAGALLQMDLLMGHHSLLLRALLGGGVAAGYNRYAVRWSFAPDGSFSVWLDGVPLSLCASLGGGVAAGYNRFAVSWSFAPVGPFFLHLRGSDAPWTVI